MSNPQTDKMDELLAKLLAGEASAEEKAEAEAWLRSDPSRKKSFEQLQEIWDKSTDENYSADTDKAWEKVKSKISGGSGGTIIPLHRRSRQIYRAVAGIALLLSVTVAAYFVFFHESTVLAPVTYAAVNEKQTDTLTDGSRIVLNKGTVLITSENFNVGNERRVSLKGEAFFQVAHNKEKPFIIEAGPKTQVRVLGTAFNVNNAGDGNVEVTVASGRVLFSAGNDSIVLTAGQSARYDAASGTLIQMEAADPNFDAWLTNKLVFNNTELSKVIQVLNAFYHADIRIGDEELLNKRLTATYENESLGNVLDLLEATLNLRVNRDGNEIRLEKNEDN